METVKGIRQELFNKAAQGLKEQGFERCVDSGGTCVYNRKNAEGVMMHCAFGWIADVPDDYNSGYMAEDLLTSQKSYDNVIPELATIRDAGVQFSTELQTAHDMASPRYTYSNSGERDDVLFTGPQVMWDNLKAFANKFELDSAIIGDRPL